MDRHSIFYLDTSGLNYLADHVRNFDFLSEMKKHLGFELYLSPISLWEILLSSDKKRRDYLIYWSQFNCAKNLLKSPAEIIINYIKYDCPLNDRKSFLESPYTQTDMGITWQNIHRKGNETIIVDLEALKKKSEFVRELSRKLKSIIGGMCNQIDLVDKNYDPSKDSFHVAMEKVLKNLNRSLSPDKESERLLKISLILLFFFVCIGSELQNNIVDDYWNDLKISDPFDRFDYIIEKYPILVVRGPLMEMAKMAEIQISISNSSSRGLIHDTLHSTYCYYSDNFFSGDDHFKNLRETTILPIFKRIIMTEQLEEIWKKATHSMGLTTAMRTYILTGKKQ